MTVIAGYDVTVSVSSDDSTYYELNGLDNLSASLDADTCDITDFGDAAHDYLANLFAGSFEIGGWFDAASNGVVSLINAMRGGSALWLQAEFGSGAALNVKCKVESVKLDNSHDCTVKWSASLKAIAQSDTTAHTTTTETATGPYAGKDSALYLTGTGVAVTSQTMTVKSGTIYRPSSLSQRIWDPSASVVVYDGGVPISSSTYTIDYLFGEVTLGSSPSGAVTADFTYLPTGEVAQVRSSSVEMKTDLADSTAYGDEAHDFEATTLDCSGSMDLQQHGQETVVSSNSIRDILEAKTAVVVDVALGDSGYYFRAFAMLTSSGGKAQPASNLVARAVAFSGVQQDNDANFGVNN